MKTKQSSAVMEPSSKLINRTDFSNRDLYVGIDVHKIKWQVAVYHEGLVLSNVSMNASFEGLMNYLHKHYGNACISIVYMSVVLLVLHSAGSCGQPVLIVLW